MSAVGVIQIIALCMLVVPALMILACAVLGAVWLWEFVTQWRWR